MACNVIREIDFDEEIQIVVDCNIQGYFFNSFVRGYHAYRGGGGGGGCCFLQKLASVKKLAVLRGQLDKRDGQKMAVGR